MLRGGKRATDMPLEDKMADQLLLNFIFPVILSEVVH